MYYSFRCQKRTGIGLSACFDEGKKGLYIKKKGVRGFDGKTAKRSKEPPYPRIAKKYKVLVF